MAILNIRILPGTVHRKLRLRATQHGRSMEAEARKILTEICLGNHESVSAKSLRDWVDSLYGKAKLQHTVDDLIAERRHESAEE